MAMNEISFGKELYILDNLKQSLDFLKSGNNLFLEDEHQNDKMQKIEKDYRNRFVKLNSECAHLPSICKQLLADYKPLFLIVNEKIKKRAMNQNSKNQAVEILPEWFSQIFDVINP